jgi:hypothetical protein
MNARQHSVTTMIFALDFVQIQNLTPAIAADAAENALTVHHTAFKEHAHALAAWQYAMDTAYTLLTM